MTMKEESEV